MSSDHGYKIARDLVSKYLALAKKALPADDLKIGYAQALSSLLEGTPPEGFYICCFCEKENLLSQWRSYGANGIGISLAFDPMKFIDITGTDMPLGLMRLWKVFYNTSQQRRIVNRAMEFVWENRHHNDTSNQLAQRAADAIQFFIPTFKNADFREEKERRLIFTPHSHCAVTPRYRVGRGMLIPYFSVRDLAEDADRGGTPSLPWRLPIRSVMVGPCAQQDLNVKGATMLLRQNGYDPVDVKASPTPYRG